MVAALKIQNDLCRPADIAAYVDGELNAIAQLSLETHLEDCQQCRDELRNHRRLICELDAALDKSSEMQMPDGFSKLVAARASSDMSGVRSATENRRALAICLILGIAGFAMVGVTLPRAGFVKLRNLAEGFKALFSVLGSAIYDSLASASVIVRVVSRKFLFETKATAVAVVVVAAAVFILSRLIVNYHRSSATE
jgi:anti-sigma factor RsiW